MLICSVSLRPPRGAIAAELVEAVTAADATATGLVVFATLVDDPASVNETVDAYLGEIMAEVANADAVVSVTGASYAVAADETLTAADAQDAVTVGAAVARAAMLAGPSSVFVNSGTVPRAANLNGIMVNL